MKISTQLTAALFLALGSSAFAFGDIACGDEENGEPDPGTYMGSATGTGTASSDLATSIAQGGAGFGLPSCDTSACGINQSCDPGSSGTDGNGDPLGTDCDVENVPGIGLVTTCTVTVPAGSTTTQSCSDCAREGNVAPKRF